MSCQRDLVREANRNPMSSNVYWLECTGADVPCGDAWLTQAEQHRLNSLRIPKRRRDWRLGRWTAKSAVCALERLERRYPEFAEIDILVLPSGAPRASIRGATLNISLSHRNDVAICAVSRSESPLGCDIEVIEPRSQAFVGDYFCAEEQACLAGATDEAQRDRMAAMFWSAKESALKNFQVGLKMDVRSLTVLTDSIADFSLPCCPAVRWHGMTIEVPHCKTLRGWWSLTANFVRTIVSEASEPLHLDARTLHLFS